MRLLDDLVEQLTGTDIRDEELVAGGQDYLERLGSNPINVVLKDHVRDLVQSMSRTGAQARHITRAGLAYLVMDGAPEPEDLTPLQLRVQEYLLGLLNHRVRRARGESHVYVPPALSMEDRERAEEIFQGLRDVSGKQDPQLIEKTRAFLNDPGFSKDSLFVKRLLRNAAYLAEVLSSSTDPDEQIHARAALEYLILEEDSIDDRLGLIGFLDDAFILDRAVAAIEPAREPWLRLIEASGNAWSYLAEATLSSDQGNALPLQRDILTEAALLSEPMASAHAPLDSALFVPTSGTASILLGVSSVIEMYEEAAGGTVRLAEDESDGSHACLSDLIDAGQENLLPQTVVVVAPVQESRAIASAIQLDGRNLTDLLPMGHLNADQQITNWDDHADRATLVFVPTLEDAARLIEADPSGIRLVLVDLRAADDHADAEDDEVVEAALSDDDDGPPELEEHARRRVASYLKPRAEHQQHRIAAHVDLLNRYMDEASTIARLTYDQEDELSRRLIAARQEMAKALALIGPQALNGISQRTQRARRMVEHHAAAHEELAGRPRAERLETMQHVIAELGMDDAVFEEALTSAKQSASEAGSITKGSKEAKRFRANWNVSPEDFVSGCEGVRKQLVELDECVMILTRANLRLVLWMAKKYRSRSFYLDMIQEGNLGLMRASRKFDHRKGARFGSYAGWWIRQAIEGYLSRNSRTIRIPVNTLSLIRRVKRTRQALRERYERDPSTDEVAEHIGLDVADVERAIRIGHDLERGCVALDGPVDNESGSTLNDVLSDPHAPQPLEELSTRQLATEARKLLETLEPLEAKVIHLRFGLGGEDRYTLAAIGELVGLTKERIRQIELKALSKLRFRAKRAGVRP
jgi:RNA polymerase primary sigma factor